MIRMCETGRNPTMCYLSRTHGLCIAWLYERFKSGALELIYEESSKMAGDIFTKAFTDRAKWNGVCHLVNIVDKDLFYDLIASSVPAPDGGGIFPTTTPAADAPNEISEDDDNVDDNNKDNIKVPRKIRKQQRPRPRLQ